MLGVDVCRIKPFADLLRSCNTRNVGVTRNPDDGKVEGMVPVHLAYAGDARRGLRDAEAAFQLCNQPQHLLLRLEVLLLLVLDATDLPTDLSNLALAGFVLVG